MHKPDKAQSKPDKQQCLLFMQALQQTTQKPVSTNKAGYSRARGK